MSQRPATAPLPDALPSADYGFESLEQEAMQEAMTEAGRQLPLLTLLLAAEPPNSRSGTLGWRVQQRLSGPTGGPHAVSGAHSASDGVALGFPCSVGRV